MSGCVDIEKIRPPRFTDSPPHGGRSANSTVTFLPTEGTDVGEGPGAPSERPGLRWDRGPVRNHFLRYVDASTIASIAATTAAAAQAAMDAVLSEPSSS